MPHIVVDYSGNLETEVDMQALCACLLETARGIEAFPMPGIRVRAHRSDHWAIADGNPAHGFVDIAVRLRAGRPDAVKQDAATRLFEAARDFLAPVLASRPLALSLELREIDPDLSPKTGTIRDHLET